MRYTDVRVRRQGTWVTPGSRHERDPNFFSPVIVSPFEETYLLVLEDEGLRKFQSLAHIASSELGKKQGYPFMY